MSAKRRRSGPHGWLCRRAHSVNSDLQSKVKGDHNILLFDTSLSAAGINQTLVQNGLEVSELHLCENTLEDYFKRVTEGKELLSLVRIWK